MTRRRNSANGLYIAWRAWWADSHYITVTCSLNNNLCYQIIDGIASDTVITGSRCSQNPPLNPCLDVWGIYRKADKYKNEYVSKSLTDWGNKGEHKNYKQHTADNNDGFLYS